MADLPATAAARLLCSKGLLLRGAVVKSLLDRLLAVRPTALLRKAMLVPWVSRGNTTD